MNVTIDISAIMKAADAAGPALDRHIGAALETAATGIADRARQVHDYEDRTQLLTNSIQAGPVSGNVFDEGISLDVFAGGLGGVDYARYIEEGTVYITPRMFLENALEHQLGDSVVRVETAIERAIKEVGL